MQVDICMMIGRELLGANCHFAILAHELPSFL